MKHYIPCVKGEGKIEVAVSGPFVVPRCCTSCAGSSSCRTGWEADSKDAADTVGTAGNDDDVTKTCGSWSAAGDDGEADGLEVISEKGDEDGRDETENVLEDNDEINEEDGIVTAASETTDVLAFLSPTHVTKLVFITLSVFTTSTSPTLFIVLAPSCEKFITALAANSALAESKVNREVGWDEKECWRLLPGTPRSLMGATGPAKSWLSMRASCSRCIWSNCSRCHWKLSILNSSNEEFEDNIDVAVFGCEVGRWFSLNASSSGGGVWVL